VDLEDQRGVRPGLRGRRRAVRWRLSPWPPGCCWPRPRSGCASPT